MASKCVSAVCPQLECLKSGKIYYLDHTPFSIGRSKDADIISRSVSVSRNHCELKRDQYGAWSVCGMNSSGSGTYINNDKKEPGIDCVLKNGDVLQIGNPEECIAWKLKVDMPKINLKSTNEEGLKLEVERLQKALHLEEKRCEEKLREQKEALENALKDKELELKEVMKNSESNDVSPLIPEKKAERAILLAQLQELNEKYDLSIARAKMEREIAEQQLKEQQEQLLVLNQAKQEIECNLSEEMKKKQAAEEKCQELATAVAQQSGSTEGAVAVNQVEEILESELNCGVCSELFITAITLNCTHTFCEFCLKQWKKKICPLCRAKIQSENRALVLDNYIQKMVDKLSIEFRSQRAAIIEERRQAEEESSDRGGRGRRGRNSARRARARTIFPYHFPRHAGQFVTFRVTDYPEFSYMRNDFSDVVTLT